MVLTDIVDQAEQRFRDTSNDVLSADVWKDYVNSAYQYVNTASEHWPVLVARDVDLNVSAGALGVTLVGTGPKVNSVYNETDGVALYEIHSFTQAYDMFGDPDDSGGSPTHYRVVGQFLEVYPTPTSDTVLRVEHIADVADLDDADEPWFPARFHRMLVSGAMGLAYEDDGNLEQAGIHWGRFATQIQALKDAVLGPLGEGYRVVQDDWDW